MRFVLALGSIASLLLAGLAQTARATVDVVRLPVSFEVVNSAPEGHLSCLPDNQTYTLNGHITGPRAAFESSLTKTVSILLSGMDTSGEWGWMLPFPGYDTPEEMAKLGHITVSFDMLGYGPGPKPHGYFACFATQASVTHQMVEQLRKGTYIAATPIAFDQVVLIAHDVGGPIAEIEAYYYKDIAGLVVIVWADQGFTPYITELAARRSAVCAAGGDEPIESPLDGYVLFGPPDDEFRRDLIYDMEPAVADALLAHRERNPCGYLIPIPPARAAVDQSRLPEITVPVLLVYQERDIIISREGQEQQASHFTGSVDVRTKFLDIGHWMMFERNADEFRAVLSDWLVEWFPESARFASPWKQH